VKPRLRFAICLLIAALASAGAARGQNGPITGVTWSSTGRPAGGVNVAICGQLVTTGAAVAGNVATLTFASNPITQGFVNGATLVVFGFTGGDTYYNGSFTIAGTSATTVSYALVHANASAGTNGTAYQSGTITQACAPLAALTTDNTAATTSPNPFTSDGLGNYTAWAAPAYYKVQTYSANYGFSFYFTGVACVPLNTSNCGALLGTANNWSAAQTFSGNALFPSGAGLSFTESNLVIAPAAGKINCVGSNTGTDGLQCSYNAGTYGVVPTIQLPWTWTSLQTFASNLVVGSGANATTLSSAASSPRTAAFPDASGTVSLFTSENCGSTAGGVQACAKTIEPNDFIARGEVTLNVAATQSITTLPFPSGIFACAGSDLTNAAGIVSFNTYAANSVTIQESGGGTSDHLRYICIGQ
jgi:hypothetical protein